MCTASCPAHARDKCEQGRICPTRLHRLHTVNGGESVTNGESMPITMEDEPVATPESSEAAVLLAMVLVPLCVVGFIALAAAIVFR